MASRAELTPMRAFLRHRKQFFVIDDTQRYKRVTVKLHARGVGLRDEVYGSELKTKKQQATKAGDLLVAEIDAKVGGVGIVPPQLAGAIVSSHYFLYDIDEALCHATYLNYYIRSGAVEKQFEQFVRGSTNYASIRAHHALELQIPLPAVYEQCRIVARIEELAALIGEAQELRAKAREEAEEVLDSASYEVFARAEAEGWEHKLVEELTDKPQYGYTESAQLETVGPKFLRITDIQNGAVDWDAVPYCVCQDVDKYGLQPGDIVFARTGATTGKSFLVKQCPEAVFASYLIRLQVQRGVEPEYLYWYFQSPQYWDQVYERRKGSAQPNMNGRKLSNIVVPVAPSEEKRDRIVAYLDGLQVEVAELTALQDATQAELDAFLPSVLDRAFKGDLL